MQFFGLLFGGAKLILGIKMNPRFLADFGKDVSIYLGISWLFLALMHRMKWNHRLALERAYQGNGWRKTE